MDNGKSGCVALLSRSGGVKQVFDMPLTDDGELDAHALMLRLLEADPQLLVIESCFRPNSLVRMQGAVAAVAGVLQIPVLVTAVTTWKKAVLGVNSSDKQLSIDKAKELFPPANLIPDGRRTVRHDVAEAVLLAHYGMLTH